LGELNSRFVEWQRFTIIAFEQRFVIERINSRWTAMHEKKNDAFGSWAKCVGLSEVSLPSPSRARISARAIAPNPKAEFLRRLRLEKPAAESNEAA
jgi:hypothetical protein